MRALQIRWHELVYSYYSMLLDSCLDEQLRYKLKIRLHYHEARLRQVES